jgi:preprotein translocase subunit Sss1
MSSSNNSVILLDRKIPKKSIPVLLLNNITKSNDACGGLFETPQELQKIRQTQKKNEQIYKNKYKKILEDKKKPPEKDFSKIIKEREDELKKLAQVLENPNPPKPQNRPRPRKKSWLSRIFS